MVSHCWRRESVKLRRKPPGGGTAGPLWFDIRGGDGAQKKSFRSIDTSTAACRLGGNGKKSLQNITFLEFPVVFSTSTAPVAVEKAKYND